MCFHICIFVSFFLLCYTNLNIMDHLPYFPVYKMTPTFWGKKAQFFKFLCVSRPLMILLKKNTLKTQIQEVVWPLHKQINNSNKSYKLTQEPHSQILMKEGGEVRQKFYTPKNRNFRICLPKKITTFFSIPQKIP